MGNVARIILYGCLAEIERYARSDSDQGKLSVFTLATPDFYGSVEDGGVWDVQTHPGDRQDRYLGSRRLLQQALYEFFYRYYSFNMYDVHKLAHFFGKKGMANPHLALLACFDYYSLRGAISLKVVPFGADSPKNEAG